MKRFPIVASLLVLGGCGVDPVETKPSNNPSVSVDVLFQVDGCKVYRFWDHGEARYFANCRGSVSWSELQGKVSVPVEVPTSE
jgi:hypothetical protein